MKKLILTASAFLLVTSLSLKAQDPAKKDAATGEKKEHKEHKEHKEGEKKEHKEGEHKKGEAKEKKAEKPA